MREKAFYSYNFTAINCELRHRNSLSLVETGRILLVLELLFLIAIVSFGQKRNTYNER